MKQTLKTVIKLIASCGFFYVLLQFIEANEFADLFQNISWTYLVLSFVITGVMLLASCMKWKVILDLKEEKQPFLKLLKVYFIGYFFSNLLPSTVGGDVVRSYYVGEKINNHAHSAVAIFIERFTGILFLFLLAIVAPLFHLKLYASPYVFIPALASAGFLVLFTWMVRAKNPLQIIGKLTNASRSFFKKVIETRLFSPLHKPLKWLSKKVGVIEEKLTGLRAELIGAVLTIRSDKGCFLKIFWLTVLFYLLTWVNVYFAFKTFGVDPGFLQVCALTPTIMFAAHLPVTLLGNIGYFESIFVFYFLLVGVPAEQSLAMSLLLRIKTLTMGIIGFFVYILYKKDRAARGKKELTEAVKQQGETQ